MECLHGDAQPQNKPLHHILCSPNMSPHRALSVLIGMFTGTCLGMWCETELIIAHEDNAFWKSSCSSIKLAHLKIIGRRITWLPFCPLLLRLQWSIFLIHCRSFPKATGTVGVYVHFYWIQNFIRTPHLKLCVIQCFKRYCSFQNRVQNEQIVPFFVAVPSKEKHCMLFIPKRCVLIPLMH